MRLEPRIEAQARLCKSCFSRQLTSASPPRCQRQSREMSDCCGAIGRVRLQPTYTFLHDARLRIYGLIRSYDEGHSMSDPLELYRHWSSTLKKFLKIVLIGLVVLLITRVSTHFFITKPQSQALTGNLQSEKLPATPTPMPRLTRDEFIQGVVKTMNERYPKMGPNGIRIDRVSYVDKVFMFHMLAPV